MRVAANGVELEAGGADEGAEGVVRGEADAVAVVLQFGAERDEGLDVAARADDLDDDVEADGALAEGVFALGVNGRWSGGGGGHGRCIVEDAGEGAAEFGVEVDVDAAVIWACQCASVEEVRPGFLECTSDVGVALDYLFCCGHF